MADTIIMEQIEIERKWLLKRLPDLTPIEVMTITQYYKDGYRYRMQQSFSKEAKYYKIRKVKDAPGINRELDIEEIDMIEFYRNRTGAMSERHEIVKQRHVYQLNDGLKAEVDVFSNLTLIMMEVELKDIEQELILPDAIHQVILMEVTGNEKFDNFNLAA